MDFFLTSNSVVLLGLLYAIAAIGSFVLDRAGVGEKAAGNWAHGFALAGSLTGLAIAGTTLVTGIGSSSILPVTPLLSFAIRIDILAAVFLGIISLVGACASAFGIAYQKHFIGHYRLGTFGFFYATFLGSLSFVVLANNGVFFLFLWEIMSLASYFLVAYEHRSVENTRAGFLYLVMTHIGTAFIICAFVLAYMVAGSFDFSAWRGVLPAAPFAIQTLIFACALIGFGTKAGIVPLHIWLPEAHPAAASHVSALMSGVMIKTAIFMLIRFFFDFLPVAPFQWGLLLMVLGGISAVLGILYALAASDIKRFLAYSSIENVGIIFLGLGASVVFLSLKIQNFALVALAAALFHTVNHAIFKSLLFLGAGSVVSATGTRNMDELGGLIKLMPYTAVFFLIGSLAVSALPPLNGFASEWLTFQVLFAGLNYTNLWVQGTFIFAAACLVPPPGQARIGQGAGVGDQRDEEAVHGQSVRQRRGDGQPSRCLPDRGRSWQRLATAGGDDGGPDRAQGPPP